jgi:hypothetical protein
MSSYYELRHSYTKCAIYTFLLNHLIYLKKLHQNPLSSFKDLSIRRDRQQKATLIYTMLLLLLVTHPGFARVQTLSH